MRRQQQFWFGMGLANSVLAPIGFMGPGTDLAGVFATALAIGSFIVLGVVTKIDENVRAEFMTLVSRFRTVSIGREDIQKKLDDLEGRIVRHEPIVRISHDIGALHHELVAEGLVPPDFIPKPEVDL